jgi:hypothetical protein
MTQDYYVVYDLETRIPVSVSGQPPVTISDGQAVLPTSQQHGEDFVLFKKVMNHYQVSVNNDGRADFVYRLSNVRFKRYSVPSNIVQDLSYRTNFITNFKIEYQYQNNELTLMLDLNSMDHDHRSNFITSVTPASGKCWIYITEHQNPAALLEKFQVNLYQLSKTKTQAFLLTTNKDQISVWATRTR